MFILAQSLDDNPSLVMFLAIVIPILLLVGLFFYFRFFLRERKKFKEESASYIDGVETKSEMNANISTYIASSSAAQFSLIKIDIDRNTELIESFGKEEDDNVLKNLALNIVDSLPKRVELARVDYDQFLLFLKGEYDHEQVIKIAQQLLKLIRKPIRIFGDTMITITASIAVAFYPNHGSNINQLNDSLDITLYTCKREGGNQMKVYTIESGSKESDNLVYYRQIKEGIKNKEFTLYYQPVIDTENKTIFGFEGLLRWNHPELGVLIPHKFINIMEQSGDINWVGSWGLEKLIKEAINIGSHLSSEVVLSLNLSPKQLIDPQLPQNFQKILKKHKISPKNIALEVAEFTLFEKHEVIRNNLKNLKELGFKISVDGFGFDFNGIKRLGELQVDIVKLDKEYMDPENDQMLKNQFINLLIDFAKENNILIVAEGIETKEEYDYVKGLGIKIIQGFHFAEPLREEDLTAYIESKDWAEKI